MRKRGCCGRTQERRKNHAVKNTRNMADQETVGEQVLLEDILLSWVDAGRERWRFRRGIEQQSVLEDGTEKTM